MDADDCARIVEGVAAVLDLLAAGGDAVDDPAPIYELLAERCRHVRVRGLAAEAAGLTDPVLPGVCGCASGRGGQPSGCVRRERFRSPRGGASSVFGAMPPACGRDMKMAATVFRWRPSWRVFACCRLYAFLSARRS